MSSLQLVRQGVRWEEGWRRLVQNHFFHDSSKKNMPCQLAAILKGRFSHFVGKSFFEKIMKICPALWWAFWKAAFEILREKLTVFLEKSWKYALPIGGQFERPFFGGEFFFKSWKYALPVGCHLERPLLKLWGLKLTLWKYALLIGGHFERLLVYFFWWK